MKVLVNLPFGAVHDEHWIPSSETSNKIIHQLAKTKVDGYEIQGAVRVLETPKPGYPITRSAIYWRHICFEAEMADGCWLTVHSGDEDYPPGVLRSKPARANAGDDITFTAPNGKRYMDWDTDTGWTALPLVV